MTCAPTAIPLTPSPTASTIPAPSKPGVAGRGKRIGYLPSIWFRSAGLIGAATTPDERFPGSGLAQRLLLQAQNLLRFSVRLVDNGFNTFAHSMAPHPNANTPAGNLQSGARVALLGMAANVVLATAKILAGALGHSYVLIADGIESALDIAGSAIIWGGLKFAARPPDETHPYGHGKAEPVAAIIVSLGVLAAAVVIAARSVQEIFQPHHAPEPFTLIVLVAVVVVKELLFRTVNRLGQERGEHRHPDRRLASSDRRAHFDRGFYRHLDRAPRRPALAERRCLGCAFCLCPDRGQWLAPVLSGAA